MDLSLNRLFPRVLLVTLVTLSLGTNVRAQEGARLSTTSIRVFEISDLTGHEQLGAGDEKPADSQRTRTPLGVGLPMREAESSNRADQAARELVEFIRQWITPSLDEEADEPQVVDWAISAGRPVLLVIGARAHHDWVAAFLGTQREQRQPLTMSTRLLSLPREALAAFDLSPKNDPRMMGTAEADSLVLGLEQAGGTLIAQPTVTAFPRRRATVSILNQQSYIVGWALREIMPGPTKLADPIVDTIAEGSVLEVLAAPLSDGTYGLEVGLTVTRLERPVRSLEIELDPSMPPLTFSLPTRNITELWTRAALVPGSTAVFTTYDPDEDRAIVVLIDLDLSDLTIEQPAAR